MKIVFTSDIDWANELVISDTLNLFSNYKIKCTLFATHKSKEINQCDRNLFEIGIHPNFNKNVISGNGRPAQEILNDLIKIYPEAIGVRSHSITTSSLLLETFKKNGIKYESNQFLPYSKRIRPYKCWNDMTIMPYNFEDDVHYLYGKSFDISLFEEFKSSEFLIMDFHPIHIYLNTDTNETYQNAREFFQTNKLSVYKNTKFFGVRDLLIRTFEEIKSSNLKTYNLKDFLV